MSNTGLLNTSGEPLALPSPYAGMLPPGAVAIVSDSPTAALAAMGGQQFTARLLQTELLSPSGPTVVALAQVGPALTPHGAPNIDEVLSTLAPICSLIAQTTRFDLATAGNNIAATLGNGRYFGHRKRFYVSTGLTNKTATITPSNMAESRTSIALNSKDSWCDLEYQAAGWKLTCAGGATSAAYSVT